MTESVIRPPKKSKTPVWVQAAAAGVFGIVAIAAVFYLAGPDSDERAADFRLRDEARVAELLVGRCGPAQAMPAGDTRAHRCGMLVRLRDGERLTFVPSMIVNSEGAVMIRAIDQPMGDVMEGVPLSDFGNRRYYERNPAAIATPTDSNFAELMQLWLEQESRPVE